VLLASPIFLNFFFQKFAAGEIGLSYTLTNGIARQDGQNRRI
jgi:hypothetical protein